jgi:ArsR family transcriptional regulator, lead/cadmium/zinc/bismuth-responsive transcriptional repressor
MVVERHMHQATPVPIVTPDECDCAADAIHPNAVKRARRSLASAPQPDDIATIFAILGDATRVRVLSALSSSELCVGDLAAATGVNRSTVSHQLRVLRSHRLVRRRREGKIVYYALDDDHVLQLLAVAAAHSSEAVAPGRRASA